MAAETKILTETDAPAKAKAVELVGKGQKNVTTLYNAVRPLAEDDNEAHVAVGRALEEAAEASAAEKDIAAHFAAITDKDERAAAFGRVNDSVKARIVLNPDVDLDEIDPPPFKVRSVAAMKADPPTEIPGLWGHHLHLGEMTSVCARGGLGKSTFTRNVMLHGAAGASLMGQEFARPLRWLYFGREGAGSEFFRKITTCAAALGYGDDVLDRIELVADGGDCQVRLTTDADFDKVRRTITESQEAGGVDVVVFDPFTRFKQGSENDDAEMQAGLDRIAELQFEFNVASWVPHHSSQSGVGMDAWRGSTAFEGTMATGLLMTRGEGGRNSRKIEMAKVRYAWGDDDFASRYFDGNAATEVYAEKDAPGSGGTLKAKMTLNVDWTIAELVNVSELSETAVRNKLKEWEQAGDVVKTPGAGRNPDHFRRIPNAVEEF